MRKYLIPTLLFIFNYPLLYAQMPQLTVDGKANNGVQLQSLKIEVKVCGTIARTTWLMTFKNTTSKILEGNLDFPLKDGMSVSLYAIDINGKMREAVPVDRSKGTEVFETIERRRVDPGLLEKVDGNTFRTRIYPINPNNTRTVLIGYEEELPLTVNNTLKYYLPLNMKETLADFNLAISVIQSAATPVFDSSLNENIRFSSYSNVYNASLHKTNYAADHSLAFSIPKPADAAEVMLQEFENKYYFLINTRLQQEEREKILPATVALLWDASLSGINRNINKEMALLDAYFKKLNNASVSLVVFSNTIKHSATYAVQNGEWGPLKKAIDSIQYDGATNFGNLDLKKINADEFILVSDGHQTAGNKQMQISNKPVYCISSAAAADYSNLKFITAATGAVLINLQQEAIPEALKKLTNEAFRFLGIKKNNRISENYPSIAVPVSNSFAVSGIADEGIEELTLQFGYGNTVTEEKTIAIDAEKQLCENFDITKVFAQKKIAELDMQYNKNKQEIERLGKQFGIVTRNTSLIVLETLNDYLQYQVEPPEELREEYDRIMKQRGGDIITKKDGELQRSLNMMGILKDWYNRKAEQNKVIQKETGTVAATIPAPTPAPPVVTPIPAGNLKLITGKVTDKDGSAVPFATIKIKGTSTALSADAIGNYTVSIKTGDVLMISATGFNATEIRPGERNMLNTVLEKNSTVMREVVVVGYGTRRMVRSVTGSVQSVSSDEIISIPQSNLNTALQGRVAGVQVQGKSLGYSGTIPDDAFRSQWSDGLATNNNAGTIRIADSTMANNAITGTTETDFDRETFDYLKAIKQTGKANRYVKYLELRPHFSNQPVYFFTVAGYLLKTGDRENGLTVLSDLAEMENGNYELYKMLGYKLKEAGEYEDELAAFKKVLELRPADPQSYRDCALAYEDLGDHQQALEMLYQGMTKSYSAEMNRMYNGIEEIFLTEINRIIALHKKELDLKYIDKNIIAPMPTDIRIVMNWNKNNTDIDLWVTDPNGEKCYYSHKTTEAGGRISDDFTEGFGPEQFLLKKGIKGKYKIQVNYFGDRQMTITGPTTIMAEIFIHYGTASEEKKIITLQMEKGKQGEVFIGEVEL